MAKGSGSNKTVLQTLQSRGVKSGGSNHNQGPPVFDDKLRKSVTPVPYSGQRGY